MLNKAKQISKYLLYALGTNVIFGVIYYLVFTWLVGYSLLYAYLGSLALIIIGLALDNTLKYLTSEKAIIEIKRLPEKDREKNYLLIQWIMDSFVSFKTVLFVFYFFILVVSQIINIAPTLLGEDISNFILANSYGIVLLIAFDRIIAQFSKDRKETKKKLECFREAFNENKS